MGDGVLDFHPRRILLKIGTTSNSWINPTRSGSSPLPWHAYGIRRNFSRTSVREMEEVQLPAQ